MTEHYTIDSTERFVYLTVEMILKRDNLNDSFDTVY